MTTDRPALAQARMEDLYEISKLLATFEAAGKTFGEALLIVEGEERPLRAWDFVHCPPRTKHTIVGAGTDPCVVVAVGARQHQDGPDWGGYPVDEVAARHGASAEKETNVPDEAYAPIRAEYGAREPTAYRDGWLP